MKKYIPSILFIFLFFSKSFSSIASFNKLLLNETLADTLHLNFIKQDLKCNGDNSGYAVVQVAGGKAPYTYSWNNDAIVDSIGNLSAGTYKVVVIDAVGTIQKGSIEITEPAILQAITFNNNVSCFGGSNAFASVEPQGGTFPYSYYWSNDKGSQNISGLSAGEYSITITDKNGCKVSKSVIITEPSPIIISVINAGNRNFTAQATGGVGSYTYQWNTGQEGATLTNPPSGTYTVTVTDGNGCSKVYTTVINNPEPVSALTLGFNKRNLKCNGNNSGYAKVQASGGKAPYTFLWSNSAVTDSITNLSAGAYTVTVRDALGNTKTDSVLITQPEKLTLSLSANNVTCIGVSNGLVLASAKGGTPSPNYTYKWSNGISASVFTSYIGSLSAGLYSVSVSDENGCSVTGSIEVLPYSKVINTLYPISFSQTDVACMNGASGSVQANIHFYTLGVHYSWTNLSNNTELLHKDTLQYVLTTFGVSNLKAGKYLFKMERTNYETIGTYNCILHADTVTVSEPTTPINISVINEGNRNFTAQATGGVGSYTYQWNTGQTGATLTNPPSGTYTVTVTDGNGCSKVYTTVIDNPEPEPLIISISKRDLKCNSDNSGYAKVQVAGGKAPYTYSWNNDAIVDSISNLSAGTYTVTVIDAVGQTIQGSVSVQEPQPLKIQLNTNPTNKNITAQFIGGNGNYTLFLNNAQSSQSISNVNNFTTYSISLKDSQGQPLDNFTYLVSNGTAFSLKVFKGKAPFSIKFTFGEWENSFNNLINGVNYLVLKDKNGCEKKYLLDVEVVPSLAVAVTGGGVSCYGGSNGTATAKITGGTAPYRYLWSNGQKTSTISNLTSGKYSVIVQDTVGFVAIDTVEITQPSPISISVVNAGNRNFTAQATGGVGSYTYQWNTGQTGATLTNPTSGTCTVTVTDGNGCSQVYTTVIDNPEPITLNFTKRDLKCNGDNSGYAKVQVSGGKAPYTFLWSNSAVTDSITNLSAGTYTVTVTDAVGNIKTVSVVITHPEKLSAYVTLSGGVNSAIYIEAKEQGGTAPYQYLWSKGEKGGFLMTLSKDLPSYVDVTDANGCSIRSNATELISVSTPSVLKCAGDSTKVDVLVKTNWVGIQLKNTWSDGKVNYIYSPIRGTTNNISSYHKGGKHKFTLSVNFANTGNFISSYTDSITIIQPSPINISVINEGNRNFTAQATGGVGSYTYQWNTGQEGATLTNPPSGTYTVTVTDGNACSKVYTTVIDNPDPLTLNFNKRDLKCNGDNSGYAKVQVSGGKAPYTYSWNNDAIVDSIGNLSAGTYTVIVTDAVGTMQKGSVAITEPAILQAITSNYNVSCFGGSDGYAFVGAKGGSFPYSYYWSNDKGSQSISGLSAGEYSITITDKNGCKVSKSVIITEPSPIIISVINAGNRNFTAQATGGVGSYTYKWNTGQTGATLTNPTSGTYTVTVTANYGCSQVYTTEIDNQEPVSMLTLSFNTRNLKCNGDNSGYAKVKVSGGKAPYTYSWSNSAKVDSISNLSAGTYTVTVTDAVGNTQKESLVVFQPEVLKLSLTEDSYCLGLGVGSAVAKANGGTFPYTYKWNDGVTQVYSYYRTDLTDGEYIVEVLDKNGCYAVSNKINIINSVKLKLIKHDVSCFGDSDGVIEVQVQGVGSVYQRYNLNGVEYSKPNFTNLKAGNYTVSAQFGECYKTLYTTITQPSPINISVINAGNRNFTAQATGGVGSYTYKWNSGQGGATLTNPPSGTYTVTVTDGNACSKVYTTVIDNPEPEPLIISISKRDLKCNGDNSGYAKVQVAGGKAPYSYSWNNNAIVDSISNLSAGTYTLTVTDAVGQTIQGSVSIQEPQPLNIKLDTTNKNITAQFSGGNGNYTLFLNNAQSSQSISNVNNFATYSISLKDSQGQPLDNFTYLVSNGTTFSLKVFKGKAPFSIKFTFGEWENSFSNLINGVNYLILKDKNGCEKKYLLDVEVVPSLAVAVTGGGVSCYGGSNGTATAKITGGTAPYRYLWSNGQKTSTISNLTSGKYSVIVQDTVGFVAIDTIEITQPSPISISVINAGNRNFTAQATGGVGSYTYQWNTGQEGAMLTNPPSGTYTVTVTDGNSCSQVYTTVIDNPNPITLSFASSPARCYNEASASASVSVVGGKEPYRYLWSNGETSASITNLYAGNYTVTVTDEAGQTVSGSVIISQPSPLQVAVSSTAIKCFGANDGTAFVNDVSGGTPPYSFEWNTGQFTTSINNLGVGNYSVLVRDEKGCSVEKSVTITEPSPITYTFNSKDVKCFNGNDGVINFYAEGGTGAYKYFYNENYSENSTVSTLSAGKYSIRVEDTNACQSQLSEVNITQPNQIQITLVSEQTPKGFGTLDGNIKVNISGGTITDTQTYQTLWFVEESNLNSTNQKNGEIVQNTLENIKGGTYNLLVKDLNYDLSSSNQGCMATFSHVLNQPSKLILASTITDKVSCYGKSDAKVSVQAEGGVKIDDKNPYTYEWYRVNSNELLKLETTSPNLEFVDAGTYRVVATDANAIKASVDVVIENPSLMTYQFTTLKKPSCPSSNDGLIAIEVSGGVGTKTVTWSNNLTGFSINNLEQGKYYGVIQDEANCIAEVAAMLNPQENVVVELLKKKELICTELCDGAIEVKVSGNAGSYELTWSNGMKGARIDNLCAGQYSVEVNTDLGCKTSLSNIDLKAPEPFKIEISNDLTICADAKVTIDAQALLPNNQNYEWTLPNKTKQTNPKLSISEAGTYIIEITNKDKCKATDVFNVKVLNKVSGVGFALSSTGKLGETIYAINLTPTEVATEWKTFGSAEIVSNAVNLLAFKAKSEGDIKVVLQSIAGDCNVSVEKTISINGSVEVKGNNLPQNSPIETLVLAYPNPNSGNFFVESDSLIIGNVELTIYDSNFAKKLFYEQYDNKDKHKIEVSLPQLSTRDVIYLEIKANNQRTVKKIMIL